MGLLRISWTARQLDKLTLTFLVLMGFDFSLERMLEADARSARKHFAISSGVEGHSGSLLALPSWTFGDSRSLEHQI